MNEKRKVRIKKLCYTALFTALSVVANVFTLYFGVNSSNAVSFNYTVCFLGGAILGPIWGFLVGACGDALGWLINSTGGAFNPAITVVSGLIGVISGLVFKIAEKNNTEKKGRTIVLTVISYLLILLVCTNLNTVSMYFYYMSAKYSFWAYYLIRMPKQIIFWAINLTISALVAIPIKKLVKI